MHNTADNLLICMTTNEKIKYTVDQTFNPEATPNH